VEEEEELKRAQQAAAVAAAAAAAASSTASTARVRDTAVAPTSDDIASFELHSTGALVQGPFESSNDAQETFDTYAAVLMSTRLLREISIQHTELVEDLRLQHATADAEHQDHFARQQYLISGRVMQTPMASIASDSQLSAHLRNSAKRLTDTFRREVARLYTELTRGRWGNPMQQSSDTTFSGMKSLVARLKFGLQALHWDTIRWGVFDPDVTALLYCTPCETAMLPRIPVRFVRYLMKPPGEREFAFLLRPEFMHSRRVEPGTLLLFRHVLPHAGTSNIPLAGAKHGGLRVVLFDMVVSKKRPAAGESQHFIWQRLLDAFGSKRPNAPLPIEYLASLQQHVQMKLDPLGHHPDEEAALLSQLQERRKEIAQYLAASGRVVPNRPH